MLKILLTWLVLLVIGFANGALRELLLKPALGEAAAQQLSVLTAILLITTAVWVLWQWTGITTRGQALLAGVLWFVLTATFETLVLNRWLGGMSWIDIAQTYNVAAGEFWGLVLVWIGILPLFTFLMRGRRRFEPIVSL